MDYNVRSAFEKDTNHFAGNTKAKDYLRHTAKKPSRDRGENWVNCYLQIIIKLIYLIFFEWIKVYSFLFMQLLILVRTPCI